MQPIIKVSLSRSGLFAPSLNCWASCDGVEKIGRSDNSLWKLPERKPKKLQESFKQTLEILQQASFGALAS
jgi:hypothetical protein